MKPEMKPKKCRNPFDIDGLRLLTRIGKTHQGMAFRTGLTTKKSGKFECLILAPTVADLQLIARKLGSKTPLNTAECGLVNASKAE